MQTSSEPGVSRNMAGQARLISWSLPPLVCQQLATVGRSLSRRMSTCKMTWKMPQPQHKEPRSAKVTSKLKLKYAATIASTRALANCMRINMTCISHTLSSAIPTTTR
eukprot:CAMPEP_0115485124 /NCGR_PEP_ID=MMETSP0271-20121206/59746_1 /TAXON_ID=71861 /ORGANISM="Scrippsiella trochoidea, Strain CCMP3099" /LENGTH=107 /DNA_ID=CAMNT_0002913069 /DNA_START=306 /DNA_END=629 /DNA_ORIENTATION=+